jgi:hypothetical protein
MERLQCGGFVGEVLKCPCRGLDLGERRLASLDAETREPPERGAFEPIRLGFANDDADREGVTQVDVRQLTSGAANDGHVACLQGSPEAGICRSLTRHERMFA